MKKIVLSIAMLGLGFQSFAQDVLYEAKIKKEEVPDVVITAVEKDYPDYVIEEFTASPLEYVESDVVINRNINSIKDYDTFILTLQNNGKELRATYDRDGNLLNSMEHDKNIAPPLAVRESLTKAYPGWEITKDTYNMSYYTGKKKRERYRLEMVKGGEKMHVYTNAKGKILNKPKAHSI